MLKTAIIGTGIAGMGCGYFLHPHDDLTLYEQNDYIGGHTNTVVEYDNNQPVHIDTGFMVFNYQTYPNICRLFKAIGAPVKMTDMSFSVQYQPSRLEYSGSSLNHLFAQRRNLLSPSFIRMLMQINRFNSECLRVLDDPRYADYTIGQFIKESGYGEDMLWKYLVPMSSAVWSTPMDKMLDFPIVTLVRFFHNHGFLGLNTQHQWWTLDKGSQSYRELLIAPFRSRIRTKSKVVKVTRESDTCVWVITADGHREAYNRVILACHGDQALQLLSNPSPRESSLLSAFKYQYNKAVLHTDDSVMPHKKLAWSSWNYRIREQQGTLTPSTIYWMNRLQGIPGQKNYYVSINPHSDLDEKKVLREIDYHHPLFDSAAIQAQQNLPQLNADGPVYFCGSYFNYGFHEDAFTSALQLCARLYGNDDPNFLWTLTAKREPISSDFRM